MKTEPAPGKKGYTRIIVGKTYKDKNDADGLCNRIASELEIKFNVEPVKEKSGTQTCHIIVINGITPQKAKELGESFQSVTTDIRYEQDM